jgi:hypothetical protein
MDNNQIEKMKALALAAEKNGEHIYTLPRDSNKWKENEAWHKAASPEAFSELLTERDELIAEVERLRVAANAVVREALDNVSVHPCDYNDDSVRAKSLYGAMADLYAATRCRAEGGDTKSNSLEFDGISGAAPASGTEKDAERLAYVLEHGLPMKRDGKFRCFGFAEEGWFDDPRAALDIAIAAHTKAGKPAATEKGIEE